MAILPIIVAAIVFVLAFVASILLFGTEFNCDDINSIGGDGLQAKDSLRETATVRGLKVAQCDRWMLSQSFVGHVGLSGLRAFAISEALYFVFAISLWTLARKLKRLWYAVLFVLGSLTVFWLLSFAAVQFMGGYIMIDQPLDMMVLMTLIILATTVGFLLVRAAYRRSHRSGMPSNNVQNMTLWYATARVLLATLFLSTAFLSIVFVYTQALKSPRYYPDAADYPIYAFAFGFLSIGSLVGLFLLRGRSKVGVRNETKNTE